MLVRFNLTLAGKLDLIMLNCEQCAKRLRIEHFTKTFNDGILIGLGFLTGMDDSGEVPESERFWKLAHKIEEKQLWAGYLSEQEHAIWRKALRQRDKWDAFIEGHGEPFDFGENQENGENGDATTKSQNGEKITDPVTTAFRARILLLEYSVRQLFPNRAVEDPVDFVLDDFNANPNESINLVIEQKPKTRDIEEDNYDDEEEETTGAALSIQVTTMRDGDSSLENIG